MLPLQKAMELLKEADRKGSSHFNAKVSVGVHLQCMGQRVDRLSQCTSVSELSVSCAAPPFVVSPSVCT